MAMAFSGILAGFLFGYVLQHGRFCMNTAFRETILSRDFTVFRAYILALVVSIVGANLLDQFGIISLRPTSFTWMANAVGGYIFGLSMVIGGGCASGTLYRIGEGLVGSWFTALGFMLGAAATLSGFLKPVAEWIQFGPGYDPADPSSAKFAYIPMGEDGNPMPVTLFNNPIFNVNRWVIIAVVVVAGLAFVSKGNFKKTVGQKGFTWWTTGIMIGLISTLAFFLSGYFGHPTPESIVSPGGTARGLSFTGPLNEFLQWFAGSDTLGKARAIAEESGGDISSIKSAGVVSWSVYMIGGVILGSLFSAWRSGEFGFRAPKPGTLAQMFGAGLIMGFSGTMAGGCNVGHGLTGVSTLALGSLVGIIFIILGCWTMVYFLFIRD